MGKIFKALEKAEKQAGDNPPRPSETGHGTKKLDVDAARAASLPPLSPKEQPLAPESHRPRRVAVKPDSVTLPPVVPEEPHQQVTPSIQTVINRVMEPRQTQNTVPEPAPQSPPVDHPSPVQEAGLESVPMHDGPGQPEGAHISLVQPETAEPPPVILSPAVVPPPPFREGVKVRYSRTQVQVNDPQRLIENKVLSVYENFETTNQFKLLRTQVLKKLKAIGGNSILVTSANPYEGKTFTSINLGVSIAKEFDRTVLIIDADIRRPSRYHTDFSTEFFSLKVNKGLTDYLEGYADIGEILINPGIDKLTLIPGGPQVDNSPELLNSARMQEMMQEIKNRYPADRLVILDGPAILHFPDATILSRYVDGVIAVVEAEKTPAENLKKMMKLLSEVNILGVVLNKNRG